MNRPNRHSMWQKIKLGDSHLCDVLALLRRQHGDAGHAVGLQALEHGIGALAGDWAPAPGWQCRAEQCHGHPARSATRCHDGVLVDAAQMEHRSCPSHLLPWPELGVLLPGRRCAIEPQQPGWALGTLSCSVLPSSPPVRDRGRGQAVH